MGIGSYRHLVMLEHPAVVVDPPTWYCAMQPAGTQAMEGLAAFFIRGRFHPGIGLETQIVFEGRTFQVQSVSDLDERHTEIQVTAVEVVGRGTTPSGTPVNVPPTIVEGPEGATIDEGESVLLTVIAAGAAPLAYQWTKDGADLAGEIYQFLETGPVMDTAVYGVRVSNVYGTATATATITVRLSYQEQVLFDGASNYWPLDDPSGSSVRNLAMANPGTISGGVTLNQPGVTADSKAMTFDGTSGKILAANVAIVPTVTFEWWQSTTSPVGADLTYWGIPLAGSNDRVLASTPVAGFVGINIYHASIGQVSAPQATDLPNTRDGQWHQIAVVFPGDLTVRLYMDGVARIVTGLPLQQALVNQTTVFQIGHHSDFVRWWQGSLQDVAIYPRALSAAEIAAHYALRVP